jgi:membrane fusion protein, multidrug efflux system
MSLIDEKTRPQAEREIPQQRAAEALRPQRPAPTAPARAPARPRWRRYLLIVLGLLLLIGAGIGGAEWWIQSSKWVSTDDAFIDVRMVQVSSQVAGRVARVLVTDNQEVHAGQPLVELDPADLRARLDQALANRQSAAGTLAQAKAQLPVAGANLDAAKAEIAAAQAASDNAALNLRRDEALARAGWLAVSRQKLDTDAATARTEAAKLDAARQKAASAQAQIGLAEKNVETAAAGLQAAGAQLAQARLTLSYTEIRAAAAGRIAKLSVAPGDYIQTGQNLMALVPDTVWVTANFKETDLDHMRVGQPVEIRVDAYPGHVFHGHVASFQAGSGAAFSLLPPENATGNYVKVVQRVPVKIVFDQPPGNHWLLGPGMSVEPYVRIG